MLSSSSPAPALVVIGAGGFGAVGLMLVAGHRIGSPAYLLVLFSFWVLSPFVLLGRALSRARQWSKLTREALYIVITIITLATLGIYAFVAFWTAKPRPPVFVIVPPASWAVTAFSLAASGYLSRTRRRTNT